MSVTPYEAASGGSAVQITNENRRGAASFSFNGSAGWYDLVVQYFDEDDGVSQFRLFIDGQVVADWKADNILPTPDGLPHAHTSNRRNITGVALRPGEEIRIEALAQGNENACLDYVEVAPPALE